MLLLMLRLASPCGENDSTAGPCCCCQIKNIHLRDGYHLNRRYPARLTTIGGFGPSRVSLVGDEVGHRDLHVVSPGNLTHVVRASPRRPCTAGLVPQVVGRHDMHEAKGPSEMLSPRSTCCQRSRGITEGFGVTPLLLHDRLLTGLLVHYIFTAPSPQRHHLVCQNSKDQQPMQLQMYR